MTILLLILLLFIVISAVAALVVQQQRKAFKRTKQDIPLKEDTVIWCPPQKRQKEVESVDYDKALLSIVIPAYNEEERLPIMFQSTYHFLCQHRTDITKLIKRKESANSETSDLDTNASTTKNCHCCDFEIVVVDDGSSDRTCDIVKTTLRQDMIQIIQNQQNDESSGSNSATTTSEKNQEQQADVLRLLSLNENRGKGAAVKVGMLHAKGNYILMADADGATDISDLLKLLNAMMTSEDKEVVVLGSRAHLLDEHSTEVQASRSLIRTILMIGFHLCVRLFCSSNIRDTQCGFKLFTKNTAQILFSNLHIERWAFDIELVVLGELLSYKLVEIPVNWHEVDGSKLDNGGNSKLNLIWVSLSMLRDMILVRLCYTLGIWTLPSVSSSMSTTSSEKKKQQ